MKDNQAKYPQLRFKGFTDPWKQRKLGELGKIYTGNTPKTSDLDNWTDNKKGHIWITPADIDKLIMLDSDRHLSEQGWSKARKIPENSVLITSIASIGKNAINAVPVAFNQQINAIVPEKNDSYFILSAMIKDTARFASMAGQTATAIINKTTFEKFQIATPSYEEQQKIGSFFKQLDNTITLHQHKLVKLKKLKQGYLQKLFPKNGAKVPELRFAGFADAWEERKLRDLLNKNSEKNKNLSVINVESVSNKTGFTKQTDQFEDYSVASADLSNYYVIREKQFAYNPSRINVGSIAYKDLGDEISVVSPLYVSFSTKKILNDGFLWNWFKTASFDAQRQRLSAGGVRDTLSFNQLSEMNTMFPTYPEQQKIGSFFKQLDNTIALHQRKLEKLQELKKGYLQKMFC